MQFNTPYRLILASGSPRRRDLLNGLGFNFEIKPTHADETFPNDLKAEQIPMFLAKKKADAYPFDAEHELVITADTVVWINNKVLNKPENEHDAKQMLRALSGNMHHVYTAVCIKSQSKEELFYDETKVYFKNLSDTEIEYYIKNYNVYDKAGSYGVQDWIGFIGIEKIEGCFYNVMGFPVRKIYETLMRF